MDFCFIFTLYSTVTDFWRMPDLFSHVCLLNFYLYVICFFHHILRFLQYFAHEYGNHCTKENSHTDEPRSISGESLQEDPNSNLQKSMLQDIQKLYEFKLLSSEKSKLHPGANHIKDESKNSISSKPKNAIYMDDVCRNHDVHNCSLSSNSDQSLNCTQLTCLDDSLSVLPQHYRRISPALGPNG